MAEPQRDPRSSTAGRGALRRRIERWSYPWLLRLHEIPRWLLMVGLVGVLVGGVGAPRWIGAACLAVLTAFLGWLSYLAWPEGAAARRALRLVAVLLAAGATALRAAGG